MPTGGEFLPISSPSAIAGAIGALISLKFLDDLTPRKRVTAVASGFCCSVYVTPVAASALHSWLAWAWLLEPKTEHGISFLIGLLGMALVGTLLKFIKVDLIEIIRGRLNGKR